MLLLRGSYSRLADLSSFWHPVGLVSRVSGVQGLVSRLAT